MSERERGEEAMNGGEVRRKEKRRGEYDEERILTKSK